MNAKQSGLVVKFLNRMKILHGNDGSLEAMREHANTIYGYKFKGSKYKFCFRGDMHVFNYDIETDPCGNSGMHAVGITFKAMKEFIGSY